MWNIFRQEDVYKRPYSEYLLLGSRALDLHRAALWLPLSLTAPALPA